MNKKRIAKFIIVAQLLTLIWAFACPKYIMQGQTSTMRAKYVKDTSSYTQSGNGPKIYDKKWKPWSTFVHIDMGYFSIGLLMIYMGCLTTYLLTDGKGKED